MFIVFVLSFKTFISSVYSVTVIAMLLSILGISWRFMSSATSVTGYVDFLCEGRPLVSSMNEKRHHVFSANKPIQLLIGVFFFFFF